MGRIGTALLVMFLISLPSLALPMHGSADAPSRSLPEWIELQLSAGVKKITIPPGRYYVKPFEREHLRLVGLKDVEIIASGVELICTQTTRAISIEDCENLTIRGLTIDYDPLPFTQGRIVAMSQDKREHTVELFEGYPDSAGVKATKYEIFDADSDELATKTYHGIKLIQKDGRRIAIVKTPHDTARDAKEKLGDLVVIASVYAPDGSLPHAIYATRCVGLKMQGVSLFSAAVFGFFETDCKRSIYQDCVVDRRPAASDLKPREYRRLRSLNADAFHSKYGSSPTYLRCTARYMGDDGIAINGDYHLVAASDGKAIRILSKRGNAKPNLSPGDPVQFIRYDGTPVGDAKVLAVRRTSALSEDEKRFLSSVRMHDDTRRLMIQARHAYTVMLDRDVELPMGSLIAATNKLGSGFQILNCELGPSRSRGVVVKAADGLIADNTIRGTWLEAVKVAPEWYWLEAGSSHNLIIERNHVTDTRRFAIGVYAIAGDGSIAPAGVHRDITIRNNTISHTPWPAILVTSTAGLIHESNMMTQDLDREQPDSVKRLFKISSNEHPMHLIESRP